MNEIPTIAEDSYRSISGPSQGLYKDNGSRFIAYAFPVVSESQVKDIVASLKKEHYSARHHCFAYRIGLKGETFRASDDGEPSSSAGRPILGQIDSFGLSDVLIVVVRYFGGIKLGIPGLIRAYKTASADALGNAEVIEKIASERYRITFGYMEMNDIMKVMKEMNLVQIRQDFGMSCTIETDVRLTHGEKFREAISDIGGCELEKLT